MENLREGLLLGLGNPLLDISANVDSEFLAKYDLKPDDAILATEKHKPLYQELIVKYKADFIAGGSVQNSLRVAQWIMAKPNVAVFFGCVGKDEFAKVLESKARCAGVNVIYQYTDLEPTGTCGVLITGTHRSLCANLAAANYFTVDHIHTPNTRKLIENAEYFYISGFFLTVCPPCIMEVAVHAFERNKVFMMNLSAPFISQVFKKPLMDALPYVDILFGNETEAETFGKEQGWLETDLKEIGKKILSLPKINEKRSRVVIITQGCNPVLLIQKDKILEYPVDKLDEKQLVDTNGAGDAFVGGFLAQLVKCKSFDVCIQCGIFAASHIIQRSGCTFEGKADFNE